MNGVVELLKASDLHNVFTFTVSITQFITDHLNISSDLDTCKVCLKKQQGLFHPLDLLHVKVLDLAFESSIELGQWEQALEFGQELVLGYQ